MNFMVCIKQDGEGCDHTIGCGQRFEIIEATDAEQALVKIRLWVEDLGFLYPDREMEAEELYVSDGASGIVDLMATLEQWQTEEADAQAAEEEAATRKAELKQLEELARKHGVKVVK